jgi:hypothetical protein
MPKDAVRPWPDRRELNKRCVDAIRAAYPDPDA